MEDRETARMRKYWESKMTRIMMAPVPHVTSGLGLRKFQADGFLLTRVYNGYRVFPGGKAAGVWRWPPPTSSAEVKERIDLYIYSTSGSSWPITGWTIPLPLPDWLCEAPSLLLVESHVILPREYSDRSMKLTTHLCQTLSLGMGGATLALRHTFSWRTQGQRYLSGVRFFLHNYH